MESIKLNRKSWIDAAKGLGIILVIIGHTDPPFIKLIYGFHMPFFFIIAGFVHNEKKWKDAGLIKYIAKRFTSYIKPYFILSFANLVICSLMDISRDGLTLKFSSLLLKYCYGIILSYGSIEYLPNCTPLWFLVGLFVASIFFYLILMIERRSFQITVCICLAMLDFVLSRFPDIQLPWNIDAALIGCCCMFFGYCIRNYNLLSCNRYMIVICALVGLIAILGNTMVAVLPNQLGNPILFWIGAFSISFTILYLCKYYINHTKLLLYLGQNTVLIIGFNYFLNMITSMVWNHIQPFNRFNYAWWIESIVVFLICCCMIKCWYILKRKIPLLKYCGF